MSSMSLDKIVAADQSIASWTKDGAGTAITSTANGGDTGLDVNLINTSIAVTATDLDIRDLTHVSDSVKIGDGTDFLAVNADGSINVNLTDDGVADDSDDSGTNPFKVGSRSYFGSALAAISTTGDRADLLSDKYRRVFINDAPQIGLNAESVTVGVTEVALPTTALAGRTRLMVQNLGSNDVFIGPTGLAVGDGLKVNKNQTIFLEAGDQIALFGIASGAGNDVRVLELA